MNYGQRQRYIGEGLLHRPYLKCPMTSCRPQTKRTVGTYADRQDSFKHGLLCETGSRGIGTTLQQAEEWCSGGSRPWEHRFSVSELCGHMGEPLAAPSRVTECLGTVYL